MRAKAFMSKMILRIDVDEPNPQTMWLTGATLPSMGLCVGGIDGHTRYYIYFATLPAK